MHKAGMIPKKLAIAICCHYNESRLVYLERMSQEFATLASEVLVIIVTNTSNLQEIKMLELAISGKGFNYKFFTPDTLGHPLMLTWAHFPVFKILLEDESFTHFMYLEDDTLITYENMVYWMEGRALLDQFNLIPSFLRVKKN